jgi:hypothetical protein
MIDLLIALVVVIGGFGLIWWAICLIRPPLLGGFVMHAMLCIAMVWVLLVYVLPKVHMPRAIPGTTTARLVVTGKPTPRTP